MKVKSLIKYTTLDYIESNGNQHIDTGYIWKSENVKTIVCFEYTQLKSGSSLHGSQLASGGATSITPYYTSTLGVYLGSTSAATPTSVSVNTKYVLECIANNGTLTRTLNGSVSKATYSGSVQNGLSNFVFASNYNGGAEYALIKLYYFQMYDNDILVRDYIPVLDSNGVPCLFDKISNEFYYNAKTNGDFLYSESILLPEGYTQKDYIESSGTQYIDTNVSVTATNYKQIKIEYDMLISSSNATTTWCVSGNGGSSKNSLHIGSYNNLIYYGDGYKDVNTGITYDYTRRIWINDLVSGRVYVNGLCDITYTPTAATQTMSLMIFGYYNGSSRTMHTARFYRCKIYQNNVLIRDMIPCTNVNNVAGMYDVVNNVFYQNSGSGTFSVGNDISKKEIGSFVSWTDAQKTYVKTEKEITTLDHLTLGGYDYIDTGFVANENTRVVVDCMTTSLDAGMSAIFGSRTGAGSNAYSVFLLPTQVFYDFGSAYQFADYSCAYERMTIDANKNVCTFTASQSVTVTMTNVDFNTPSNLLLGTCYDGGNYHEGTYAWRGNIYSCKIYDNDVLVRDFVPALDDNGIPCLYDKVGNKFYYNQGTGAFWSDECVKLPEGYAQKEYLEATGTQYINTGIKPTQDTQVVATMMYVNHTDNTCGLMGTRTSNDNFELYNWGSQWVFAYGTSQYVVNASPVNNQKIYINASKTRGTVMIGSAVYNVTPTTTSTFTSTNNLLIYALNRSGTASFQSVSRVYTYRIYENGVLIRNFIPCVNTSNVAGLYDVVNNVFYQNSGSGTFTVGGDVSAKQALTVGKWTEGKSVYVKVTEDLTVLDYVESTGTQYIDTQYIPNSNTRVVMDFQVTQVPSSWYGLFSSREGSSGSYGNQYALWMNSSGVFRSNYSTDTGIYLDSSITSTGRHLIDHNKNVVTMDGNIVATHSVVTFTGTYTMFLFAGHTGGSMELPAYMKLYSCKIYDNDVLARDYIPVLDPSGVACLYDKVTNQCYYNQGTGSFTVGYKTELPAETELAFLESSGTEYIDTGVVPKIGKTRVILHNFCVVNHQDYWNSYFGSQTSDTSTDNFRFRRYSTVDDLCANWGDAAGTYYSNYIYNGYTVGEVLDTVEYGCNGLLVNGELATASETTTPIDGTYPIYLFASNEAGSAIRNSVISFSSCQIYEGDTLIRDYIPKTDSQGVPALFDKVSGTYYYNSGTGTFNAGTILKRPYWKQVA